MFKSAMPAVRGPVSQPGRVRGGAIAFAALLLGFTAASIPARCASAGIVFESPLVKVFLDEKAPAGIPAPRLRMARGERESIQLLITAGERKLERVTVRNSFPSSARISAEVSLVGYVRTAPGDWRPWDKEERTAKIGWWPDPLLPNRPFDVAPGETQPVWITVSAPKGARAGRYKGTVTVNSASGEQRAAFYTVQVFDVDLPEAQTYRNAAFMPAGNLSAHYRPEGGIGGAAFQALYERWLKKAFSEHLGPTFDMLMGWNQGKTRTDTTAGPLGPTEEMRLGRKESFVVWPVLGDKGRYDFRIADSLLEIGRRYGMRQFAMAMFGNQETWEQHTGAMKADMAGLLASYTAHLRERGMDGAAYVYNADEPAENMWDTVRRNYQFVKSIDPNLKVWLCLNEPHGVSALGGSTDIWDVYIRQYEKSGVEARRRAGEQVIWAVCVYPHQHPNLFIEYPAVDARMIGWLSYRYGVSGFEYWGLNQWGENTGRRAWANFEAGDTRTSWRRTHWPWGDGWLLYPGDRGEPLSSVRFENLRDGFEDAELLRLLESRGGAAEADRIVRSIARSTTDYASDPNEIERAHDALLTALERYSRRTGSTK